ncbi:acyl-CoA thioesterase [Motiliproteus sp. MSK22-1]|uniref:acyl-CoA thioesterase n=1 Tax=Motiliproteus sp. MSK22-1 TaxID=1897630 RepID=UPI0009780AF3|nr:hotdog domain-containing protein [Motiliproteus sp. MSK22-1]OMH27989.1 acyl-CoA thioesterase [Motiliproteus sp. MSK22-1]
MDIIDESPPPEGYLTIQLPASSRDTNIFGDVNGGWLSAQMVLAAETRAAQIAKGRIATVSIGTMEFVSPVLVGTLLSFYTEVVETGNSSIRIKVDVWGQCSDGREFRKISETETVQVAIDLNGHIRALPENC